MSEKITLVATSQIDHDGKAYVPGDRFSASPEQATVLMGAGAAEAVEVFEAKKEAAVLIEEIEEEARVKIKEITDKAKGAVVKVEAIANEGGTPHKPRSK